MKKFAWVIMAFMLVSCGDEADESASDKSRSTRSEPSRSSRAEARRPSSGYGFDDTIIVSGSGRRSTVLGEGEDTDLSTRYLAYEYRATVEFPADQVDNVFTAHVDHCLRAGSAVCRVTSSQLEGRDTSYAYAELEFSATRVYMTAFIDGLDHEAEASGGTVESLSATVEDLSREITDTAARLEAKEMLRERLLLLLDRDIEDVSDILEVEEELSRVQSEIESTRSYLQVLEGRVSMDSMLIEYEAIDIIRPRPEPTPLRDALRSVSKVVAASFAEVITFIAKWLPWLIIILPGLLILRLFIGSLVTSIRRRG